MCRLQTSQPWKSIARDSFWPASEVKSDWTGEDVWEGTFRVFINHGLVVDAFGSLRLRSDHMKAIKNKAISKQKKIKDWKLVYGGNHAGERERDEKTCLSPGTQVLVQHDCLQEKWDERTTEKKLLRDANDEANKKKRTVEKRKKPKFSFTLSYLVCILYLVIKKISCLKRAKNLIKYEINLPHQPRRRQQRQSSARKVWKIQVAVRWLRYNARSSCSRVFKRFYLSRKMRFSWCDP